jgi:energy-coupling factor transporter ATP-binding protein EcfA2
MNQRMDAVQAIELSESILKNKKNSFLYFTGDNGSGKSTLLLDIGKKISLSNKERSLKISSNNKSSKIIAYSMAPFSKFDSREAYWVPKEQAFERIGGGSSGTSRYALLFQAIVQFCIFDSAKHALFQEIAEVTRFSATFKVRLGIDRHRMERFPREEVENNELAKKIISSEGVLEVLMCPGTVKILTGVRSESILPKP